MTEEDSHLNLAVDFDRTLTKDKGYNPYPPFGEEVPDKEIIDWVNEMHEHHKIIIHTSRTEDMEEPTREWLETHNVNYDELYFGKPKAVAYIDDKAIRPNEVKNWRRGSLMGQRGVKGSGIFRRLIDRLHG